MLRKIRIAAALVIFVGVTLCFIDFTGNAAKALWILPHYQLIPALLSLNIVALAILMGMTLLFGRIYCSVLCPLGVFQDIIGYIRKATAPRRKRKAGLFRYKPANNRLRNIILAIFIVLIVCGLVGVVATSYAGLLDPYSIFGRAAGQFLSPISRSLAIPMADAAAAKGIYPISGVPATSPFALAVAIVAALEIGIVTVFAIMRGRDYCNTICPVGTLLGILARISWFKPRIDLDKCNSCGSCGRHCKAQCINTKEHKIDYSRCVGCMDCLDNCTQNAISFRRPAKKDNNNISAGRRAFISASAIAAGSLIARAADKTTDGGLAPVKQKKPNATIQPPIPAGAISLSHLRSHCTACQLCVSACPSGVLRPSLKPANFMQPEMVFTEDFCRTTCNVCGSVCPTGAIKLTQPEEKSSIKIGKAIVDAERCISAAYGQNCGSCSRHCPTGAIVMTEMPSGHKRPAVNDTICIGCGACENHCPVGTAGMLSSSTAAIYVVGIETHTTI